MAAVHLLLFLSPSMLAYSFIMLINSNEAISQLTIANLIHLHHQLRYLLHIKNGLHKFNIFNNGQFALAICLQLRLVILDLPALMAMY